MRTKIKKIFSGKHSYRVISIFVLAVALVVAGISYAFFTSQDRVDNEVSGTTPEIQLLEPNWTSTGSEAAKHSEPGTTIDKDPYVYNNSGEAVYVRIMVNVTDANGKAVDDDTENAILKAILLSDGNTAFVTIDGANITCNNSSFYYYEGYYYYMLDNSTIELQQLEAEASTEKLFNYITFPVTKAEYQYFEEEFNIVVTAQAITVDSVASISFSDIVTKFVEVYES
ncbi:MAG: hypothetical protein LUC25_07455 [Ruminococcus sp.]|nr:hypothetical protein [Ruminococcus sp.]